VIGVIVAPELRGQGAGRAILGHTLRWAGDHGHDPVWVATGPYAAGFYQSCGWELTQTYRGHRHDEVMILRCATGTASQREPAPSTAGQREPAPSTASQREPAPSTALGGKVCGKA
jgi:predicted acetyltransferase